MATKLSALLFRSLLCCAARPVGVYRQFIVLMAWQCSSLHVSQAGFSFEL